MPMEATAFARARHVTAAGTAPHVGVVAADPTVLPLGTRIRIIGSNGYDGNYCCDRVEKFHVGQTLVCGGLQSAIAPAGLKSRAG